MATSGGPDIERDGLVFGYDTGYGAVDNNTSSRFYQGKPTENMLNNTSEFNLWTLSRNSGDLPTITTDVAPNPIGILSDTLADKIYIPTNGTYPRISQNFTPTSTSLHTFSIWLKTESGTASTFLGIFRNSPWNGVQYSTVSITDEWQRFSFSFTPLDTSSHQIYIGSHDSTKGFTYLLWGAQMEVGSVSTPYSTDTRSSTQSLIDLTKTTNIDVSNVSFDSTGQPTFDGTDDRIDITSNLGTLGAYTFEYVAQSNSSGNMPVSSRTSTAFYKYGAYSWRYTHGGVASEFYHTSGADTGWAHWVITYDGSTITVYENNISKGTKASTGTADFTGGIRVGSWTSSASYTWDGQIPVLKVYNRALTADEVQQNYNAYKNRFNL